MDELDLHNAQARNVPERADMTGICDGRRFEVKDIRLFEDDIRMRCVTDSRKSYTSTAECCQMGR